MTDMKVCSYPECGRALISRGFCQSHYHMQRKGEPLRAIKPVGRKKSVTECSFDGCDNVGNYSGLCWAHHQQTLKGADDLRPLRPTGSPTGVPCSAEGCVRLVTGKGMCTPHRRQWNRGKLLTPIRGEFDGCTFEGCERPVASKGLCQTHARQRNRHQTLRPIHVPAYRYTSVGGYIELYEPAHPNANKDGRVFEHVKVMSTRLGRPIRKGETVHHRNGVKDDNRIENLELWASRHPKGQRVEDLLAFAHEIIETYEAEAAA